MVKAHDERLWRGGQRRCGQRGKMHGAATGAVKNGKTAKRQSGIGGRGQYVRLALYNADLERDTKRHFVAFAIVGNVAGWGVPWTYVT